MSISIHDQVGLRKNLYNWRLRWRQGIWFADDETSFLKIQQDREIEGLSNLKGELPYSFYK